MFRAYKAQLEKMGSSGEKKLKIVVFLSSVREGRMAPRVSKFLQNQLKDQYDVTIFDPEELDLPMLKMPLYHYQDRSQVPKVLLDCEAKLKVADAFLMVTAEYNHSIPPALTNALNHFTPQLFAYKPSGIVCYSMSIYGGMRAAMQLRCFLSELGTLSVSNIFGIPEVHKAFDDSGLPLNDQMTKGLQTLMSQLSWHAHAMKNHRDKVGVPE